MATKIETIIPLVVGIIEAIPTVILTSVGDMGTAFKYVKSLKPNESLGMMSDRTFTIASKNTTVAPIVTTGYEFTRQFSIFIQYVIEQDLLAAELRCDSDALYIRQVVNNPQVWTGGVPAGLRACRWISQGQPTLTSKGVSFIVEHVIQLDYAEI